MRCTGFAIKPLKRKDHDARKAKDAERLKAPRVIETAEEREARDASITVFPRYSRHALRGSGGEFLGWED